MHHSTDDETTGFKDRERRRSNATHTRQSLGAVGRVASRVRNSGMSRLTKANSFLQRQKEEEEEHVNESPWGVGISAVAKGETNLSEESRQSIEDEKTSSSSKGERRSDMVELSSPLSADQHSPSRQLEGTLQNTTKEEDWLQRERPNDRIGNDRIGNDRIGSDRKSDRRTERGASVLGAAGAARGLVKSVSKFGFRNNGAKSKNDLTKATSTLAIPTNDLRKVRSVRPQIGKRTSGPEEDAARNRAIAKDLDSDENLPEFDSIPDTRIRGFHLPSLGRGKAKPDGPGNKSRTSEKSKLDMARSKSKAGVENSKGSKSGLGRSISHAPAGALKTDPNGKNSPKSGPDSGKSIDGKKNKNRKSFKDAEQKPRKGRPSWFGFAGDPGESQTRGTAQNRGKLKARRQRSFGENDPDSELGSRASGKAPKDLAEMQDFAIDEYFDSEEDDMETGSAPRSMVDDDFITYQTGKGKKAQGNRSKSRMRSQT